MVTSSIKDDLKSFKRSWVHHTGMQLATLTVLAATFSVIAFVLSLSMNFKRILASWGDGVQMTVYLNEDVSDDGAAKMKAELASMNDIRDVTYIPRDVATDNFKKQMASYAPDLLGDSDFANPFPSSFRLSLKGGVATDKDVSRLEGLASVVKSMAGVEDVSYGQSWVQNYSSFVSTLNTSGGVMAFILLAGSLLVIGNSIRASISTRRDEIEILELVGATSSMIRRPFVVEGLLMGALAAAVALALNLVLLSWQKSMMSSSLVLSRLVPMMSFLDIGSLILFCVLGSAMGALGAWLTVRRINDGWSAKQSLES
jgi:cell division transport system permease protein